MLWFFWIMWIALLATLFFAPLGWSSRPSGVPMPYYWRRDGGRYERFRDPGGSGWWADVVWMLFLAFIVVFFLLLLI